MFFSPSLHLIHLGNSDAFIRSMREAEEDKKE